MKETKTFPLIRGLGGSRRGFSLIELIIVIVIIGILSGAAYIGIQRAKIRTMNDKVLDDLIAISNSLEQYKRDHFDSYPIPEFGGNMNLNCFYADATYAHDCAVAAFRQGMIDNNLLTKRYLSEVPTDPRTGSRYVYGVSKDGKYFEVAGIVENSDGTWTAKTVGNLGKGYHLPSLIRAYNGPNFVVDGGGNLPYSPDHMTLTATLENINGEVYVCPQASDDTCVSTENPANTYGQALITGDIVATVGGTASVDLYFSDGSVTHLAGETQLKIQTGTLVEENDSDSLITKIRLKLLSGKIWNKVARLASSSEFNVEASGAIAGVRGTEFGVDVSGAILVYSGEICLDSTEICATSITGTPETPGGATGNPELVQLMEEQTSGNSLNDNIIPHILLINETEIQIADINRFMPEGGSLFASKITAFDSETLNTDTPEQLQDWTPIELIAGAYTLHNISGLFDKTVVFRFEDDTNPNNVLYSGFSIPVTITGGTITEEEIYGGEVEKGGDATLPGGCQITLNYPIGDFYSKPESFSWNVIGECDPALDLFDIYMDGTKLNGATSVNVKTYTYSGAISPTAHNWYVQSGLKQSSVEGFTIHEMPDTCTPGEEITTPCYISIGAETVGAGSQTITCLGDDIWSELPVTCPATSCKAGYQVESDTCVACVPPLPTVGSPSYTIGCDWKCGSYYTKVGNICKPDITGIQVVNPGTLTVGVSASLSAKATVGGTPNTPVTGDCAWSATPGFGNFSIATGHFNEFIPAIPGYVTFTCTINGTPTVSDNVQIVAAGPTFTIVGFDSVKPYYKEDNAINLAFSGFGGTPTIASNPTTGDISGTSFTPSEPGTYILTATKDTTFKTLSVTVCGYTGDPSDELAYGSVCWVMDNSTAGGRDCNTVCTDPNPAMVGTLGLSCDTGTTWNDDTSCSICGSFISGTTCSGGGYAYAPYLLGTNCKYRDVVSQSCVDYATGKKRICKCQ